VFQLRVGVGDPSGERFVDVPAIVGSYSSHLTVPAALLRGLGVEPARTQEFIHGDGRSAIYPVGQTRVQIGRRERIATVGFAPEGTRPESGEVTLGIFCLRIEGTQLVEDVARA